MAPLVSNQGSGTHVLAVLDGNPDLRGAALAAADLFASTPRAEFTLLAPASVASPGTPSPQANGNGLVQLSRETSSLVETVRLVEGKGVSTRLQTTETPLMHEVRRIADAYDLLVLPRHMAERAGDFDVPVLVV